MPVYQNVCHSPAFRRDYILEGGHFSLVHLRGDFTSCTACTCCGPCFSFQVRREVRSWSLDSLLFPTTFSYGDSSHD